MVNIPKIDDSDSDISAITLEVCRNLETLRKILDEKETKVGLARISIRADPREKFSSTLQINCGLRMRINKKTTITMPLHHIEFDESYSFKDFQNDLQEAEKKSTNPNFQETIYIKSLWLRDEVTGRVAVFDMNNATLPEHKSRLKQESGKFRANLILEGIYHVKLSKRGHLKIIKMFLRVPKNHNEYAEYKKAIRKKDKSKTNGYSHLTISAYEIFVPNISRMTDLPDPPLTYCDCTYSFPSSIHRIPKHCSYYTRKELLSKQ